MSLTLLSISAFVIVAMGVSLAVALARPLLRRGVATLAPAHQVRAWAIALALPLLVAGAAVGVAMLASSIPSLDHCLAHGTHHPHLCANHAPVSPGGLLLVLAAAGLARGLFATLGVARAAWASRRTARGLGEGSRGVAGLRVFECDQPRAFVIGLFAPQIFVSEALFGADEGVRGPILAHEAAHQRARHPLGRALATLLGAAHLPFVGRALRTHLATAQELHADAVAARVVGDRLRVADALLHVARGVRAGGDHGGAGSAIPAFAACDVALRVRALLEAERTRAPLTFPALALACVAAALGLAAAVEPVHHALEHLLALLS